MTLTVGTLLPCKGTTMFRGQTERLKGKTEKNKRKKMQSCYFTEVKRVKASVFTVCRSEVAIVKYLNKYNILILI